MDKFVVGFQQTISPIPKVIEQILWSRIILARWMIGAASYDLAPYRIFFDFRIPLLDLSNHVDGGESFRQLFDDLLAHPPDRNFVFNHRFHLLIYRDLLLFLRKENYFFRHDSVYKEINLNISLVKKFFKILTSPLCFP